MKNFFFVKRAVQHALVLHEIVISYGGYALLQVMHMNCFRVECHVEERFAENRHTHVVIKRLINHADVAGTAFMQGIGDGHHALQCNPL